MAIAFPSLQFFEELSRRMDADRVRFEKLGFCDTVMGVRVLGKQTRLYALTFEVFECSDVRELTIPDEAELDFTLEAELGVWREMLESIQKHGSAEPAYTLNSLSHLGDRMRVVYDEPEGHDAFYRFMATLQAFVDQAAGLDIDWVGA
ncbi:MAG: hypothetical protein ACE5FG_00710 [Myxococcota bacterium]